MVWLERSLDIGTEMKVTLIRITFVCVNRDWEGNTDLFISVGLSHCVHEIVRADM